MERMEGSQEDCGGGGGGELLVDWVDEKV